MNLKIESIKTNIAADGVVGDYGEPVVEIKLRDEETGKVSWHSISDGEGAPNYYRTSKSIFKFLNMNPEDLEERENDYDYVDDHLVEAYMDYDSYFDQSARGLVDPEYADILALLVYLAQADYDKNQDAKKHWTGKLLSDIAIPWSDAEYDFRENMENT